MTFAAFKDAAPAPRAAGPPALVHVTLPPADPLTLAVSPDGLVTVSGGGTAAAPPAPQSLQAFAYAGKDGVVELPPVLQPAGLAGGAASLPPRVVLHVATDSANVPASHVPCSAFLRRKGAFYKDVLLPAMHPSVTLAQALARFGLAALHAQGWGAGLARRVPGAKHEDPLPMPPVAASLLHALVTADGAPTAAAVEAALRPLGLPRTLGLHIRAFDGSHDYPVVPSTAAGGRVGFGDPRASSLAGFIAAAAAAVKDGLAKAGIPHNATRMPPGGRGFGRLPALLVVSNVCLRGFAVEAVRAGVGEALGLSPALTAALLVESPRSLARDALLSIRGELGHIRGLSDAAYAVITRALAEAEAVVNAACGPGDAQDAPAARDALSARSALFEWAVLSRASSAVVGSYWSSFSEEAGVAAMAIRGAPYVAVGEGGRLLVAPAPFDGGVPGSGAAGETCGYPAYIRRAMKAGTVPAPDAGLPSIDAGIEQYTFDIAQDGSASIPATPAFRFIPCRARAGMVGLQALTEVWGLDRDEATTLYCPPA